MQLMQILDPRDPFARLRRSELVRLAAEKGIPDISEQMPKELIVKRLKAQGFIPPAVAQRPLDAPTPKIGVDAPVIETDSDTVVIDAAELAEREWLAQQKAQKHIDEMNINELRDACKQRGIKMKRTDKMQDLRDKLRV